VANGGSNARALRWHRRAGASIVGAGVIALVGSALAADLKGTRQDDRLKGTQRGDRIVGLGGDDVIRGRRGADGLAGGGGRDRIVGGPGEDALNAIGGNERGARGKDRILARDGSADLVNCGPGRDVAVVDAVEDGVYDCERVRAPKEPPG
jgi:Ca2+-binding RTX toxin-like protein